MIRARFQWGGASKPPGSSFFIGTSPAFEMALYTACFFQSSTCTCQINGKPLTITSVNFNKKGFVLTAFPRFWNFAGKRSYFILVLWEQPTVKISYIEELFLISCLVLRLLSPLDNVMCDTRSVSIGSKLEEYRIFPHIIAGSPPLGAEKIIAPAVIRGNTVCSNLSIKKALGYIRTTGAV